MERKPEPTVRLNSHVRTDQKAFIKKEAKRLKLSEGQINRMIIDFYMKENTIKINEEDTFNTK